MEAVHFLLSSLPNNMASADSHLLFSNTVCSTLNNCNVTYGCILQNFCALSTCRGKLSCLSIFNIAGGCCYGVLLCQFLFGVCVCELFKSANLLKTEFVSLYIPPVTVWVKIAAPNCHGKSRYGCDMKRFSVTI